MNHGQKNDKHIVLYHQSFASKTNISVVMMTRLAYRQSWSTLSNAATIFSDTFPGCHTVPAHQALHCQVELSLGRLPDPLWKRRPGRPNKRWLDKIRDNNRPPADVRRDAVRRGHSGATQKSTPTYRQWRWRRRRMMTQTMF